MKNMNYKDRFSFFIDTNEQKMIDKTMSLLKDTVNRNSKFERSEYSSIINFFNEINEDYDTDLKNPYWAFTHDILKFILVKYIKEHFDESKQIKLFDAGAGTGNWSQFILGLNSYTKGYLFDMNPNMLKIAYPKILKLRNNQTKIIEGNLEVLNNYPSDSCNLIICMHNVIGLGRNTDLIIKNLFSFLEIGGMAFIMAPNKYHAFNFTKKYSDEHEVLRVLKDDTVKFKPDMPEMFCYSPIEFKTILEKAGFNDVTVLGFPVTVYPSITDTKLLKTETLEPQLKNIQSRKILLELEKKLCIRPELAYRGASSLIAVCKKNTIS